MVGRTGLTVIIWLASLQPAMAEAVGRITLFLEGRQTDWFTVEMPRRQGAMLSAGLRRGQRMTSLDILAFPGPRFDPSGQISLEVRFIGPYGAQASPHSADLIVSANGLGGPFWTSRGARSALNFEVLSLDSLGSFARVEAVFSGQLCLRPSISVATDPDRCKQVSGFVETRLQVD